MSRSNSPLVRLFEGSRHFLYERGDIILRAGDTPSGVYLITSGWVKVYSLCSDGEPNIIVSLRSGDVFPLPWALTGSIRNITFAALDTTSVLRISHEEFDGKLASDKEISHDVYRILSEYSTRLESELENLNYRSARERVAFRLVTLADSFGQKKANKAIINVRVPNEYIARSSNMTRETASREMSRLARKDIIRHIKGYVVVTDMKSLKAEAGVAGQDAQYALSD